MIHLNKMFFHRVPNQSLVTAFLLLAFQISSVPACNKIGGTQQPSDYKQSEMETDLLPSAKAVLNSLPVRSAASIIRMLLDLKCENEVSQYLGQLSSEERTQMLRILIYEGAHFGSTDTLNFTFDQVDVDAQKNLILQGCKGLANGKHYSLAIDLAKTRLQPDDQDAIQVDIATYAYIFGETELARQLVGAADAWAYLKPEVLEPRRQKFVESANHESKMGIDQLWSGHLATFRVHACSLPPSEEDLVKIMVSEDAVTFKLCALFTWCATEAKARRHNGSIHYYQQFETILTKSDVKTQLGWKGERMFLAIPYANKELVKKSLLQCIEQRSFDVTTTIAGVALGNFDMSMKLAEATAPLTSDAAFDLAIAVRNAGLLSNIRQLPDILQIQIVAALH